MEGDSKTLPSHPPHWVQNIGVSCHNQMDQKMMSQLAGPQERGRWAPQSLTGISLISARWHLLSYLLLGPQWPWQDCNPDVDSGNSGSLVIIRVFWAAVGRKHTLVEKKTQNISCLFSAHIIFSFLWMEVGACGPQLQEASKVASHASMASSVGNPVSQELYRGNSMHSSKGRSVLML